MWKVRDRLARPDLKYRFRQQAITTSVILVNGGHLGFVVCSKEKERKTLCVCVRERHATTVSAPVCRERAEN